MTELCDEQNESHVRHGVRANASIQHDPLAHLNGHSPQVDPVTHMEENCDLVVDFDDPVICIGHDRGLRYFFRKA